MRLQSLSEFLAPISGTDFVREFYGRKPLYLKGAAERFVSLLRWTDLNEILLHHRIEYPRLRLVKEGTIVESERYMRFSMGSKVPRLDLKTFTELLVGGSAIVIDQINEIHQPIADVCLLLERALLDPVSTNMYAGWHRTQGFVTHWDDHDVFIAQVIGRKHWRVYAPSRRHPVPSDGKLYSERPTCPSWEGDLLPGDVLYMPRGWWHDAVPTTEEATLHLTFGVYRKSGLDFAQAMMKHLAEYEELRADLPRFSDLQQQDAYLLQFQKIVGFVAEKMTLEAYFREMDSMQVPLMRPSFPWTAIPDGQLLPQNALLHWLPPRRVYLEENGETITLSALGSNFAFANVAAPVLRSLMEAVDVPLHQLCSDHLEVDPAAIRRFVIQLLAQGLITVTDHA